MGPWEQYALDDPHSIPENWTLIDGERWYYLPDIEANGWENATPVYYEPAPQTVSPAATSADYTATGYSQTPNTGGGASTYYGGADSAYAQGQGGPNSTEIQTSTPASDYAAAQTPASEQYGGAYGVSGVTADPQAIQTSTPASDYYGGAPPAPTPAPPPATEQTTRQVYEETGFSVPPTFLPAPAVSHAENLPAPGTSGPPPQPAYDPLSSAYPVTGSAPAGTPGTGSGTFAPAPTPNTLMAAEQGAYEDYLAAYNAGLAPGVIEEAPLPAPGGVTSAPATDPALAPALAPATGTTGTSGTSGTGAPAFPAPLSYDPPASDPGFVATYPFPSPGGGYDLGFDIGPGGALMPQMGQFGPLGGGMPQMDFGADRQFDPHTFDPFTWAGVSDPRGPASPMRDMVLEAMQLGQEIGAGMEQQRQALESPPPTPARDYVLRKLGLHRPDTPHPAPPLPLTPPPSAFDQAPRVSPERGLDRGTVGMDGRYRLPQFSTYR